MGIDWPSAIINIERRTFYIKEEKGVNGEEEEKKLVALVSDLLRCVVVVVRI